MLKKKIPTLVGLLLLVISTIAGVLFLDKETGFLPRAAPEYIPRNVKVTNLMHSSFTVSWLTQEPSIGFVKYGTEPEKLNQTAVDERDQLTGSSGAYRSHYITIQELNPETTYYFKLGSYGKQLYDNQGSAFTIATGPLIDQPPSADTAYGTVNTPAQTPAAGAIVYVSLPGATPVSSLVQQNGSWSANLATARNLDLTGYLNYDLHTTLMDILVQSDDGNSSQVVTTTGNDQPVPDIVIGQNADHTGKQAAYETSTSPDSNSTSRFTIKEIIATEPETQNLSPDNLDIDNIPEDDTIITQNPPQFSGSAPANIQLTVTIHSNDIITANIDVDEIGAWNWTPPSALTPGDHTITLSYADTAGILHTITRRFTVQAASSSNSPQYQATPSATLSPTQTPTNQPSGQPTSQTTPTPRLTGIITPPPTPTAGNLAPTYLLSIFGITLFAMGVIIFKKLA